jgi:hypothetical protein
MLYIVQLDERPDGYSNLSDSAPWVRWLGRNIPANIHQDVRSRLNSNLKHLIVGLELKTALITPHWHRTAGQRPVLFEPYFQNLVLEFCVAAFSVVEGIGSAHWLSQNGHDGSDGRRITRDRWLQALVAVYDGADEYGLKDAVERTLSVRDKLHQDKIGARAEIDWHAFSYDAAFVPASTAIRVLLRNEADTVPGTTNLNVEHA